MNSSLWLPSSINLPPGTKAGSILQGFSGLHESYAEWLAWVVCGVKCSDCEAILQGFNDLRWSECSGCGAVFARVGLARSYWKSSNGRCVENRSVESFSLRLQGSEIDWLISRWNEFKRSVRESILLNYLPSKTIARFGAKFGVTKACFFVVV
jgi:hypothetical protein